MQIPLGFLSILLYEQFIHVVRIEIPGSWRRRIYSFPNSTQFSINTSWTKKVEWEKFPLGCSIIKKQLEHFSLIKRISTAWKELFSIDWSSTLHPFFIALYTSLTNPFARVKTLAINHEWRCRTIDAWTGRPSHSHDVHSRSLRWTSLS